MSIVHTSGSLLIFWVCVARDLFLRFKSSDHTLLLCGEIDGCRINVDGTTGAFSVPSY